MHSSFEMGGITLKCKYSEYFSFATVSTFVLFDEQFLRKAV